MAQAKKSKHVPIDPDTYPYDACRDQRHHWAPYDAVLDTKVGVAYRVQKCNNCSTKKHSVLSLKKASYGEVVGSPRYQYPGDYQVKGGLDKYDLGQIRMHNVIAEARSSE